jgi:YkoY family integral membrane protein
MKEFLNYLVILFNMVTIESLLSIDNVAVLAVMVGGLPQTQQKKALMYGMLGAYVFRGVSLLFLGFFIHNPTFSEWAKFLGGLFLLKLAIGGLIPSSEIEEHDEQSFLDKIQAKFKISKFMATIIGVELLDFTFSIDNLFAAVAFTENISGNFNILGLELSKSMTLTVIGVFLGIALMRFVAQGFIKLIELFPLLNQCAFIVVGLLGIKLVISGFHKQIISSIEYLSEQMKEESFDMGFSLTMVGIFLAGVIISKFKK